MRKIQLNNQGFTLVEMMMISGMLMLMGLAASQLVVSMTRSMMAAEARAAANIEVQSLLRSYVGQANSMNTTYNQAANRQLPFNVSQFRDSSGVAICGQANPCTVGAGFEAEIIDVSFSKTPGVPEIMQVASLGVSPDLKKGREFEPDAFASLFGWITRGMTFQDAYAANQQTIQRYIVTAATASITAVVRKSGQSLGTTRFNVATDIPVVALETTTVSYGGGGPISQAGSETNQVYGALAGTFQTVSTVLSMCNASQGTPKFLGETMSNLQCDYSYRQNMETAQRCQRELEARPLGHTLLCHGGTSANSNRSYYGEVPKPTSLADMDTDADGFWDDANNDGRPDNGYEDRLLNSTAGSNEYYWLREMISYTAIPPSLGCYTAVELTPGNWSLPVCPVAPLLAPEVGGGVGGTI